MIWFHRTRAAMFVFVGITGVVAGFVDAFFQIIHLLLRGTWHFQSFAEWMMRSQPSSGMHLPAFLFYIPICIVNIVVGWLLLRSGTSVFSHDDFNEEHERG